MIRNRLFLFVSLCLLCLVSVYGQRPQRPRLPGESWEQLFNGKDLSGWVNVGQEKWEVTADGEIHGQGITNQYGYLRTEKKYKSFHLFLRFKCLADGNSGVYFHTDFKPGTVDVSQGRQFEIDRCAARGLLRRTGREEEGGT